VFTSRSVSHGKRGGGSDSIPDHVHLTRKQRYGWRALVAGIVVACIAAGFALFYGLIRAESSWQAAFLGGGAASTARRSWAAFITSLLSGVFLAIVNMIWVPVCFALTRLEKHLSWTHFRISQAAKLLVFKILMLHALYLWTAIALKYTLVPDRLCLYLGEWLGVWGAPLFTFCHRT
jgi:hypothetical protein